MLTRGLLTINYHAVAGVPSGHRQQLPQGSLCRTQIGAPALTALLIQELQPGSESFGPGCWIGVEIVIRP